MFNNPEIPKPTKEEYKFSLIQGFADLELRYVDHVFFDQYFNLKINTTNPEDLLSLEINKMNRIAELRKKGKMKNIAFLEKFANKALDSNLNFGPEDFFATLQSFNDFLEG